MAKKSSGETLLVGVVIMIAILAGIPKELWIGLGVLVVIFFVARAFLKKSEPEVPQASVGVTMESTPPRRASGADRLTTVVSAYDTQQYAIPRPIHEAGAQARWVMPGASVNVAGLSLPGGLLYVGSDLRSSYGLIDPALINPALRVTQRDVDMSIRLTDYWPSYSDCTPDARRAYLQWLADGRRATEANIGYVFLFFYGLERRALVDAVSDSVARSDIPAITREVKRLLAIYSESGSFRRYASQFLAYIEAESIKPAIYKQPPPSRDGFYELSMDIRIGLGQLVLDQQPIPDSWALAWALADPNILRRTAVRRCPEIFAALFKAKYAETHGDGLRLPVNRTKLKIAYQPASAALRERDFTRSFGGVPDVSALSAPIKKLQELVNGCTELLCPFGNAA